MEETLYVAEDDINLKGPVFKMLSNEYLCLYSRNSLFLFIYFLTRLIFVIFFCPTLLFRHSHVHVLRLVTIVHSFLNPRSYGGV